ncbi:BREX-1 system adenine-specific DNA-methyltransferase PglX [Asaccharospora irregularis]|uniref:site-specific DNA-methyltransferase (adenine-specific) n=1 Tax=Asaccharospora irregularis DSM 2635 TaxID=1121321 RepID=A0A1M5R2W0_9FIRM|nr:BREX-1 system adenine-specific DNA-methyltransferase PglX [Asaccharospora irregularis]SHH20113.1 Methyltransferase domain-containing protein [Asaccharospora irregularis DSM 2635]
MNKTAIKNFAIWARRELIEKVTKKAKIYGIEKDKEMKEMDTALNGQVLTSDDKKARRILIEKIDKDGFDETIEEVAYTWFNRFIAIRFMEVNGYIPSHIRVFTSENNEFEPQILSEAIHIDLAGLDKSKVLELYNAGNKEEELFNYLFITQCNALNEVLPGMFQKLNDYTELLLPDGLLRDDSVIDVMISEIPEEDWKEQVQIIGWLYQYYNTEPKDEVFSRPKSEKIQKEDIPAATQLFTPDWIVRYMVENSLGRLWIEGHPDDELKENWKYYIEEAEQEKEVEEQLSKIRKEYEEIKPEDIKCIDPAIGSGHIGAYLFDVLIQIYESYGYKRRDAVSSILENNIYGLDIDERARQLAYFSLMMKARQYDRRFLSRRNIPQPKIYAIEESNFFKTENGKNVIEYFANGDNDLKKDIDSIIEDMTDAKEYGSITVVNPVNFEAIYSRFNEIRKDMSINMYGLLALEHLLPLVEQAEVLSSKYDVVVTNPPYMGSSGMNPKLSKYVNKNYKDSKSDLFAVFMESCKEMTKNNKFQAMITQHSWMFLSSFEKLRKKIQNIDIVNMAHLGPRAFEEISGEVVQTTSFVFRNKYVSNYKGTYIRLIEANSQDTKENMFLSGNERYFISQNNFKNIPGIPIAYWASANIIKDFEIGTLMEEMLDVKQGLATADNNRFLRLWHEVTQEKCKFDSKNAEDLIESKKKWIPYNKGGQRRQWYGNYDYIVNWENDGVEIKNFKDSKGKLRSRPQNTGYYFKEAITWGLITSGGFSIRYRTPGGIHDVSGMSAFYNGKANLKYILGLMGTSISNYIFKMLNPTINLQVGDFKNFPVIIDKKLENIVIEKVAKCIYLSKLDWDMHETSWDFEKSPLLSNKVDGRVETAYESYKGEVNQRFAKLKENEEELNRIFIGIYNLKDELTPEVSDRDITVAKIFDSKKDIDEEIKGNKYVMTREDVVKNFLSYFIGCAMGRYSLDEEGLVFAGGEFDSSKYTSFRAVEDGILPITDQEYFEDDIVELFVEFLKITFGEEHLNENLDFIASELKGKKSDSSRERIRNYFLNDFYKDHCKMYQKLPIYWQYDSGRNSACRGLFYLHRYDKDMFAKIRINYVFEVQDRYKQELTRIEDRIAESSGSQKIELQKRADVLKKKIIESQQFEEKVQHIADSYIEIDLDDGVKENYKIFKDVLSKIK